MANEENLKSWKKGQSGNPNGRPKGSKNRSTIVKKWLEALEDNYNPISGQTEKMTQEDIMTLAVLRKARNGDIRAYKELMDSLYGTNKETIDISTDHTGIDFDELMSILRKNAKS